MQPDTITVEEAMRRINAHEKLVFVDVRDPESWDHSEELIGGATRVPPGELVAHVARLPRKTLVVYCDSPREQTSRAVARELRSRGFHEVRVLSGGLRAWKESHGFLSAKPMSTEHHHEEHFLPPASTDDEPITVKTSFVPSQAGPSVPATPMGHRPSAHRRQPDEQRDAGRSSLRGSDVDIHQRISVHH